MSAETDQALTLSRPAPPCAACGHAFASHAKEARHTWSCDETVGEHGLACNCDGCLFAESYGHPLKCGCLAYLPVTAEAVTAT